MSWNGYGLSWWRCRTCAAARKKPTRVWVNGLGRMVRVEAAPCKRCGSTAEPICIGDPWQDFEEVGA